MSDGRRKNGQFEAGHKFSPGRKLGQRPKRSIFEEQLLTREPELTRAILDHAVSGNAAAVQAIAKLLSPSRRRWRGEPLRVPEVKTARDVAPALTWVIALIADGSVTEHEGQVLVAAIDAMARSFVATDFEERLQRLEGRRMIEGEPAMRDAAE